MKKIKSTVVVLFSLVFLSAATPRKPSIHDMLDPLTGRWKGTFKVYTLEGRLHEAIEVEQRYWWEGDIQRGRFVERYADGRVVNAEAMNYIKDGRLVCEVRKDNGEISNHRGRYENGVLFWHTRMADGSKVESFKERVETTAQGTIYYIDGFGAYGRGDAKTYFLFEGRYKSR